MSKFNTNGLNANQLLLAVEAHGLDQNMQVETVKPNKKSGYATVNFDSVRGNGVTWLPTLTFVVRKGKLVANLMLEDANDEHEAKITSFARGDSLRKRIAKAASKRGVSDKAIRRITKFVDTLRG